VLALYSRALDGIDRLARWTIIAATATMIAVVTVQVLLRYAFNSSLDWSDEVSRLLFVWCMFLAIPLGIREGAHVGIELLVAHVGPVPRALLAKGCALIAAAMMAVVLWQAVKVANLTWDELMQTVSLSANWFMVPVAISAAHSFLHLVQLLWRQPVRTIQAVE
jgi:TRAP-type C4-dicarboxylate transport system permease small subunit